MENNENSLVKTSQKMVTNDESALSMILDTAKFEHLWRVAKLFANSKLLPEIFRGKTEDCFVVLQMAIQLKMQPYTLFNTMYVIHGKPAFESKMLIAMANASGVFEGPIRFKYSGEKMTRECTAFAKYASTGEVVEQTVTMQIAKDEGWIDKPGSKWKTMPDLMLSYRAASWLIRLYAPEVMYGFSTKEEAEDVIDVTPKKKKTAGERLNSENAFDFVDEAEILEPKSESEIQTTETENLEAEKNNEEPKNKNTDCGNRNGVNLNDKDVAHIVYTPEQIETLIEQANLKSKTAVLNNLIKSVSDKPQNEWSDENWELLGKTLENLIARNKTREEAVKAKKGE